jgi:iron(III) transport system substrate-binding protein
MRSLRWMLAAMLGAGCAGAAADEPGSRPAAVAHEGAVVIYAAADQAVVQPLIDDFEARYPGLRVEYHDMNSTVLYHRVVDERARGEHRADVVWSSAMDLQVKLVNDGYAQPHRSAETAALPDWAVWKDEAFGTTYEPAVLVYNKQHLAEDEVPDTRIALIRLLAGQPERFRGRVASYDPARSGLGLLLHSQDAQANPIAFWQLARGFGALGLEQHVSTADMLDRVVAGQLSLAYNVLGSYADKRARQDSALGVVWPRDYTLVLSRVAFIMRDARHPQAARLWLDHMLSERGQALLVEHLGLQSIRTDGGGADTAAALLRARLSHAVRPITIGSGLLAYQDQAKQRDFLRRWAEAMKVE